MRKKKHTGSVWILKGEKGKVLTKKKRVKWLALLCQEKTTRKEKWKGNPETEAFIARVKNCG